MDQESGLTRSRVGSTSSPARSENERSIEKIRQDIEHTRNEITDTVDLLSEKIKQTVDWKSYIREYPLLAVGGAAIVGFFFARKVLGQRVSHTDELLKNLIRTATEAIRPKRNVPLALLTFAGKYAFDKFQQYQQEQQQQQQLQEQLEQLQALQLMQQQFGTQPTSHSTQHRVAGTEL